jgi:hypothetical protein
MEGPFDVKQHLCKCGCKNFYVITELYFDAAGCSSGKDGWQFKCIKCGTIYDKNGQEGKPK